jgi:hypothetical protein
MQVYHIYVDKLRVLGHGYGPGPSSPKKHKMERDDTTNDAFKAFESVAQEMILALTS